MADVNANIGINFDTSQALAQLRQLQAGLSRFNQTLTQGNVAAMQAQKGLNDQLMQAINATGKFVATQKDVATSTSSFTQALEKNQMSMRQYFRYTAAAATQNTKVFKGMFAQERETLTRASKDRVKLLQSQYIQLQAANGNMIKTLQVIPKHLKMVNGQYADYATRMQMAAQRQQFLNKLLSQGSTQLLNFGKNTQWAGRQLMVGLTIPLTILGSTAAKTFMEMEQAITKFSRVYGDMMTNSDATDKAIADVQRLAKEFTKFGIAAKDTVEMAASAAAMGLTGNALSAQVIQATRLAVLGQVEQQQALETTISLTNAFGIASEDLAKKINYLNAVENQTVLSIEDLTIAIPKAGPVVKQLGGSVEDLAFFMTAMKEGGINASEGANALKSGLASMINPSKKASEFLAELGINITGIVNANAGDLKGTVVGFARALDTLDPLNRARAIEQMFGKFQFARLSTLFQNITKDGTQASRALGLAGASVEELAILSERELGKVEDMTGNKFKKSMENLKLQLIPIGKAFLQAVTPIVNFVGRILEKFNTLGDGTKKVITVMIGVIGGLAPVALMTFGVLMNAVANGIKLFAKLRGGIAQLNGSNNVLGGGFEYLTNEQIENVAQANALHTSHSQLISTFNVEAASVQALAAAYGTAASQARALAQSSPGLFNTVPGPAGAVAGLPKYAKGKKSDVVTVGGTGNKDTELALLTPGETVISAPMSEKYGMLINAMIDDKVAGYAKSKKAKTPQQQLDEYDPTIGSVTGGLGRLGTYSGSGFMSSGNTSEGFGADRTFFTGEKQGSERGAESFAGSLFTTIQDIEGSARIGGSTIDEFVGTFGGIRDVSDELFRILADGYKPEMKKISELAAKQYQAMVDHVTNLEEIGRLTKEQADKIRLALRKTYAPELGTYDNPGEDAAAIGSQRTETTLNEDGEVVVKRSTTERPNLPGRRYLKDQTASTTEELYRRAGLPFPKTGPDKLTFAHPTDTDLEEVFQEPEYRDKYAENPSAALQELKERLARQKGKSMAEVSADPNLTVGQGTVLGQVNDEEIERARELISKRAEKLGIPITATEESVANAETAGKTVGEAAIKGVKKGADTESPSKKGIEVGKDIADGVVIGLQEGTPEVASQSEQLGDAAVPKRPRTAAETQAKVDKMDLDNKAFYSDLDTPEFRDERQILKSQDRQRRKRAKEAGISGGPGTPPVSGPSSLTVSSTARTEAAAEDLAVSTEQAATAQSQVVQQIHDESKSRVTIKGNTINIGKAREEADRLDKEASDAEAAAAKVRTEAAKWEEVAAREGGKNMHTAENAKALKKLADEAEIKAAEARIKAAEAEIVAAQLEADGEGSEQIIQDPVKTPAKVKKAEEIMSNGTVEAGDGMRRIVDGTDETADSTLLVAEQTDELASVTGEAVDAQTQTADNLLTGAQITDATTGNLNDVLQSTDITGVAQDDIAGSSENIADINRDIEEDKRKIRALGQQELAARMKDAGAVIPDGAQSDTKRFDRTDAPSYTEAYDEVMGRDPGTNGPDDKGQTGYTRNKKGQFIFDPETGEPTTLTQKQVTKKKRGMRKEKVAKFSGKATGALGTATMIAGAAGAPPQVTAALGTAATVAQFAPMIAGTGPIGLAVGAVVALGAGAYMLNKHFNQMAAKAAQFAKDLSATRDGLKAIGQVSGKVGASEIMDKRRESSQYGKYDESIKIDNTFGNKFLGTDAGKKEKKLFQDNVKKFGNDKAINDLSLKLAAAVADGVLDAEAANSIAAELALQVKDQKVEMQVIGQLGALLGPDGENLKNKPLETRLLLMDNANQRVTKTETDIAEGTGNTRENVASVSAYNMNNIEMATMMADQIQLEYETQKKKLEAELASTTNAQKKLEITSKIAALDATNLENSILMNAQLLRQLDLQTKSFEKVYSASRWGSQANKEDAYFDATRTQLETTYKGTDQEEASKKFLNTTEDFADNAFSNGLADQKTAQTFQAKMEMLVGSKVLSPTEANNYIELFSGQLDKFDVLFDASVEIHGPAKTKELLNMFAGYENKVKATELITQISLTKQNPAEYDAIMETLKGIQALDGTTIDMELLLTTVGLEGVERLKSQMEGIEKLKEAQEKNGDKKMDLEKVRKLGPIESATVDALIKNTKRKQEFDSLTLDQQAEYLQKLQTQFAYEGMVNDTQRALEAEQYARQMTLIEQANGRVGTTTAAFTASVAQFKASYMALDAASRAIVKVKPITATGIVTKDPGPAKTPTDKGKKDDPFDFLNDLAMRIKMTRDASFDATKPLKSMIEAMAGAKARKNVSSMFEMFKGVQQTLIGLKVPKELRDYIAGLSAEEFKELEEAGAFTYAPKKDKKGNVLKDKKGNTIYDKSKIVGLSETSKTIVAAYNEAPLENFNLAQKEIITNTDNQFKAFTKLKAEGVDTATALEMLQDEALAAALASGQIKGPDLKKFADDAKLAADAAAKYAVISDLLKKNEEMEFKSKSVPKLAAALKATGMSVENIQTVLQDPALAKQLIKDLEDGKIDSQAIADYLKNIKDEKIVEIRGKFNAGDFAGAAAPGMELVSKLFSAQEALIRTGVSGASSAMVKNIKSLKSANEDLQLEIQKISLLDIRPIEIEIEKATRNLELNITRPLEAYQESISDLQRIIEIEFERPIAEINAENAVMSQDMEIMNHAAEEINKRYDEQAEALSKVSEIKSQLVEQEKEQLDLADALSKGDIGAAARAIQAIRAAQAARNAENASKALELSRKNKIDNLTGEKSGLTKEQITERQYQNNKTIYDLENYATTEVTRADGKKELLTRLDILKEIQDTNDKIYDLEEKREAAQLAIRKDEDRIYAFKKTIDEKQLTIDQNNLSIATDERAIEKLVENITVLGKTKDVWDGITAKIEASSLAGQDFDGLMGGMLASVDKIDEGWKSITDTMSKYSSSGEGLYAKQSDSVKAATTEMATQRKDMVDEYNLNAGKSKELIDGAKEKIALAQEEYDIAKKKYDLELESLKTQLEAAKARNDYKTAGMINSSIVDLKKSAPKAPVTGPNSKVDNANINYNDITDNAAQDIYDEANAEAKDSKSLYKYKGTGGATGGSQSGGGGGGNSTPLTPAQKKAAAEKAAAEKKAAEEKAAAEAAAKAGKITPPIMPTKAILAPTTKTKNLLYSTTAPALGEKRLAKANEFNAKLKSISSKYTAAYQSGALMSMGLDSQITDDMHNKYVQNAKSLTPLAKDKAAIARELEELSKLRNEYKEYGTTVNSKNQTVVADLSNSTAATKAASQAKSALPKDVVEVLEALRQLNASIEEDKSKIKIARDAYSKAKTNSGYPESQYPLLNFNPETIKKDDPDSYKTLLPLYTSYKQIAKDMDSKSEQGARGRYLIKNAGYKASDFNFYFERGKNYVTTPTGANTYNSGKDYPTWKGYATGGLVSSKFAQNKFKMGTDTVPAMLTPGEFVMNKFAVQSHGIGKMQAMNNGQAAGDSVYNYSISVNVKSESNPDEIARTVIAQIKSVDAQKMRGVRT